MTRFTAAIILPILFLMVIPVCAADVYVATTGNDSNPGTIESPKLTIQAGVNALATQGPGNTLYMRGGTYTTLPMADTGYRGVKYKVLNAARSWDSHYTICSYPGEWAIIDASSYDDNRIAVFHSEDSSSDVGGIGFIEFSRFEIKGVSAGTHMAAIGGTGGPWRFRYLYLHDNRCDTGSNNPGAIRLGNGSGMATIEYCCFKNNGYDGNNENSAHIVLFSDFSYTWGSKTLTNAYGFSRVRHDNNIRYNMFDNASVGIKHKGGVQYLASNVGNEGVPVDTNSWSALGDKVHHNIFLNSNYTALYLTGDFTQAYNNIIHMASDSSRQAIQIGMSGHAYRAPWANVIYNNTTKGGTRGGIGYIDASGDSTIYNQTWAYNNIVETPTDSDSCQDMTFSRFDSSPPTWDYNTYLRVENNLFYKPTNSTLVRLLTSDYTLSTANSSTWGENNYSSSTNNLFGSSGADLYIASGNFVVTGSTTIANGGYNAAHPYLSGVTIPRYVGAVNPSDSDWVAGVLSLATYTNLRDATAGSDPTWIEGSEPTPPSTPSFTGVMTGIRR